MSNIRGMEPLIRRRNVKCTNLYVQVAGGEGNVERALDVSPNEMEIALERGSRASGGFRQVNPKTERDGRAF